MGLGRPGGVMRNARLAAVLGPVCLAAGAAGQEPVQFERDIAPLFQGHCIRCHQPGSPKGDISLATDGDLRANDYLVPGDPNASYLIELVAGSDGSPPSMPKEGERLSADEVALLRTWIAQGAVWPSQLIIRPSTAAGDDWWSLQPLSPADPPDRPSAPRAWRRHPIDRFVYARLHEAGLQPSPPADPRTLIRRVTYDLTGLPPTVEQTEAFIQACRTHNHRDGKTGHTDTGICPTCAATPVPDAVYQALVDRLLASPGYGERWGRHWLDVVRFGESRGFERNEIILNAWPFRDYIIDSFNHDKPFDQLVLEHLAGDVLDAENPDVAAGTTFLVCGPYDDVGNQDPVQAAQIRANTIDEMIRAVSEGFLGLTIGCARCHDHKFDPIAQEDYYRLYTTFAGVHHGSRAVAGDQQRQARQEQVESLEQQLKAIDRRRQELVERITDRAEANAGQYVRRWTRPPIRRTGVEERFAPIEARLVRLIVEGLDTDPRATSGYRIEEFQVWTSGTTPRNVALARSGATAVGASRRAEDFSGAYSAELAIDGQWGASWIAQGPELVIELAEPTTIERVFFCSDYHGAAKDQPIATFVSEYRLEVSRDGMEWTPLANSYDRRAVNAAHRRHRLFELEIRQAERHRLEQWEAEAADLQRQIAQVPELPSWWVGQFRQPDPAMHVFVGGDPQRTGPPVAPASPGVLADIVAPYELPPDAPEGERRLALARWIISPENPLTARVLGNRLWHYHFGTGIVATPSDLGYMGQRPSHPELLDWLAGQLHHYQWRLKPLHRLIVTSQTYRQASGWREQAGQRDAENRLLWRFPPRRLAAEEIRDTMLSFAGVLDTRMGGRGFRLYRYLQDNVATYVPLDQHGPDTYRRAVYHHNARASRVDVLADFDCPETALPEPRRASTLTPLQALTMLNHSFTIDMAEQWARRLQRETAPDEPRQQIRHAFAMAFLREPDEQELMAGQLLVRQHGLAALCRALLNSSEWIFVE